jgi:hypothetical protein
MGRGGCGCVGGEDVWEVAYTLACCLEVTHPLHTVPEDAIEDGVETGRLKSNFEA